MIKFNTLLVAALVAGASCSDVAMAASGPATSPSVDAKADAKADAKITPNGGSSADHISASGKINTNGANAKDRALGADRADARADMKADTKTKVDTDSKIEMKKKTKASSTTDMTTPNGGKSADHLSAGGKANTNGPNAKDRVLGDDRAAARSGK